MGCMFATMSSFIVLVSPNMINCSEISSNAGQNHQLGARIQDRLSQHMSLQDCRHGAGFVDAAKYLTLECGQVGDDIVAASVELLSLMKKILLNHEAL